MSSESWRRKRTQIYRCVRRRKCTRLLSHCAIVLSDRGLSISIFAVTVINCTFFFPFGSVNKMLNALNKSRRHFQRLITNKYFRYFNGMQITYVYQTRGHACFYKCFCSYSVWRLLFVRHHISVLSSFRRIDKKRLYHNLRDGLLFICFKLYFHDKH